MLVALVTGPAGEVSAQLDGEEGVTFLLAGPAGCLAPLGGVTLDEFGLAPDPVRETLVPAAGLLA